MQELLWLLFAIITVEVAVYVSMILTVGIKSKSSSLVNEGCKILFWWAIMFVVVMVIGGIL